MNSKHLKTKQNCKLEAKFLSFFWVLHPVGKQTYKLKLPKKWKIYYLFYRFLLEQNTTKKKQVNDTELDFKFKACNNIKNEIDGIWDSVVYAKESAG